ncbi:Cut8 six-helix bundle-domain-containing protein [Sporodiniella umbellata]|nr:Cut8 six-helix bundle-domain-containing protein [Sporodiniella umbellata]
MMHHLNKYELTKGRKRRNSEDEEMSDMSKPLFRKDMKKHRLAIQKRTSRISLLENMDKEALIHVIQNFLTKEPGLIQDVMTYIPEPTISSAINVLVDMEKKFLQSFPFNKSGMGRDDYTFSRVREPLADLIETLIQYANHFTSPQVFPTTCFTFLDHATHIAHRLPAWDNEDHNAIQRSLYQQLNEFWTCAVQSTASKLRQGETYSPDTVSEWARSLAQHNGYTNSCYFTESVHEFTKQLGFMIGLPATTEPVEETPVCHVAPPLESTFNFTVVGDRR